MRQRNIQYAGHMTHMDTDQHGMNYIHPEPCVFYGSIANFPHPHIHTLPAPGNTSNLVMHHHPPGHHENAFFYGPQHPATSLDLAVATSNPYNHQYMVPPYVSRDFPVPGGHGAHEQIPFSSTQVGIHTDHYGRSYPYADGVRGMFKGKNAEGIPGGFPYHDAAASSSSAVGRESDVALMGPTNFAPSDYRGNETSSSMIENESHMSVRNRTGTVGSDSVPAHNANHLIQGNYVGPPFQLPGNPWLRNNGAGNDALAWNQAPPLPYLPGSIGGGRMEAGAMAIHGYQLTANSRSSANVLHHPLLPNVHPPLPPVLGARGHSMSFPSQVASSQSTPINALQGVVEATPRYVGPVPPSGFRLYTPHRREDHFIINARHRNLPHLRILPEDGVAMLEVPGYHEVVDSVDQHRDMRLDIDHMSYEELLALGERIGSVASGVSEEIIVGHLKTRSFVSHVNTSDQEETASGDRDLDFCVICQNEYKDQENVGTVDCGHEYHVDCIKKWLLEKNSCPICKSTALKTERKEL